MQSYEKRLLRVLDYIHANPAGDLSLDAVADVAAMIRFHWHRVFRAMTGETAAQAVGRVRLYRASVALVQGSAPLQQIARDVGCPNIFRFSRAFSESYLLTPAAFRNRGELRPFTRNPMTKAKLMHIVQIRKEPARHLAAVPHTGPYHEIGRGFERLGAALGARGLMARAGRMVGVYYDDPAAVRPADLHSHAGIEMPADVPLSDPLVGVDLAAGRCAVLTFKGPYAGLPAAYDQLYSVWLPASGEEPADRPLFEVYLNTPMDTAPDDLITEVCLPLK